MMILMIMYDFWDDGAIPHICHQCHQYVCGKQIVMWRTLHYITFANLHYITDVEKSEIFHISLFFYKIIFLVVYADSPQNPFCPLHAFAWRKIEPKIVPVEKKLQL